ncbi:MAG: universal stress protein [Bacteroidota bacterium]|nr:universal stress protein [Bacteroidota bacterium]
MKNILVGIDFSKGSLHALEYAINLANITFSDVIMLWVDNLLEPENGHILGEQEEYKDEASQNITELMENWAPKLINGKLHYKIRKGKVYSEIAIQAKLSKSSFVVTGTHEKAGFDEFSASNDAYRVVTSAPCPVITIHPNYQSLNNFNRILLPIDTTSSTMQKVPVIVELAGLIKSDIHILGLNGTGLVSLQKKVDDNVRKVEQMLQELKIASTTEIIKNSNITQTILTCADRIEAGLISIMTEQEPSQSSLMMGPQAQHIISMSTVPVLSIQPQK